MDPPRSSPSSSPAGSQASTQSRPRPPIKLRRFLELERSILAYRPSGPRPPEKPDRADEVLEALAAVHGEGDRIGLEQICAAGKVPHGIASTIRRWARSESKWPYRDRLTGYAALAEAEKGRQAEGHDA